MEEVRGDFGEKRGQIWNEEIVGNLLSEFGGQRWWFMVAVKEGHGGGC
ncbi:hypothetical protein COLO4_36583 [Corchorus olitorius]|uniref:Uncharacterized protein n=1 Tax=Corchorus olitorius TaxID=93759 RepID=A0A1R3G7S4_9ROSI|nr:hypothetical protein COLO4_36583 [Corchorus olitorius]